MNKTSQKFCSFPRFFVILTIILGLGNTFFLAVHIITLVGKKPILLEPGSQFAMFRPYLKGVRKIGYITNRDLSDGAFLQAQYYLVRTILDLH